MNALKAVEELSRLNLDNAHDASNTSELAIECDCRVGGRRRHQSGHGHTPERDHTMEEASQSLDEMLFNIDYDMACNDTSPLPSMAHDDIGLSHRFAHEDTCQTPSMVRGDTCPPTSSTKSPLPTTRTSPPQTTGAAPTDVHGSKDMIFMPTPGRPTLEFVHTELS